MNRSLARSTAPLATTPKQPAGVHAPIQTAGPNERQNAAGKGLFVSRHDALSDRKAPRVLPMSHRHNAKQLAASHAPKHKAHKFTG